MTRPLKRPWRALAGFPSLLISAAVGLNDIKLLWNNHRPTTPNWKPNNSQVEPCRRRLQPHLHHLMMPYLPHSVTSRPAAAFCLEPGEKQKDLA